MWRPLGVGWAVGTAIPIPTGEKLILVLTRRTERGPVERGVVQKLDELRPHLARSAFLSARLQLERARIASETLAALGLPALVLNDQGKVLAANSLIEALTGYVQWRALDRVRRPPRPASPAASQPEKQLTPSPLPGRLAKYRPRPSSRHLGKNRLPSSSRHRRAPHRNLPGAANTPGLTRRQFRRSQNLACIINLDGAGVMPSSYPRFPIPGYLGNTV